MLCYRCGSLVPASQDTCPTCGLKHDAAARPPAGAARRRNADGAPYKPGDVVAGRYAIQEVVGSGPMGFVFRALDEEIDVEVALKAVHPRLVQQPEERMQFSLSMRVAKKLSHPNLLRVYEEGVDGDRPFITLQLLEGMTLRRMLEQRTARGQLFSLKEVEPLLSQMAAALDAAHRFGPHSDLKPENVIVLPDLLKVTDYGLGLAVPHLPFVQAQKGQRADVYIAPEYVGGGELDTRMDVYSLAVIVGELLTGLVPEDGVIPGLTMHHPDLPTSIEALYRRALNFNPLARPKTAGELLTEFSNILARTPAAVVSRARSLPAPPGSSAANTARQAARPPPPVPTGMLPAVQEEDLPPPPGVAAPKPPAPIPDLPPVDATQPLDAASLAAIMGRGKPASASAPQHLTEQALPFIAPPVAAKAAPSAQGSASRPVSSPPVPSRSAPARKDSEDTSARGAASAQESEAALSRSAAPTQVDAPAVTDGRSSAMTLDEAPAVPTGRPAAPTLDAAPAVGRSRSRARDGAQNEASSRSSEGGAEDTGSRGRGRASEDSGVRTRRRGSEVSDPGARSGAKRSEPSEGSSARAAPRGAVLTRSATRAAKPQRSMLRLALLVLGCLALGAGGGFLAIKALQKSGGQGARGEAPAAGAGGAAAVAAPVGGCPAGMRLVSGGAFKMGRSDDDALASPDERPVASIQVSSFCVDEYEFPNQAGAAPKVAVAWEEARGACEREGKRLCTEEEWEKACKGPGNSRFPFGEEQAVGACNTAAASGGLAVSGRFARCKSGYAVMDLAGNAAEWTSTRLDGQGYALKGGAFDQPDPASRCSARSNGVPTERSNAVGFRCCASVRQ
ncbi:bifunctional serine/threonine-protein kinase/formylglycine-generating enzyme family protein [Myxococcus sp. AM010]|uniref:bifunctional serine/threonine-protein kinase/formylglycine-generating enzyme family protein n=1 Tax=Myxococcus sp. AM010 TaxID=2745138 RepID=UPI001595326E|nr:bifunctional serine/threonine-protein kinase/formylglycine-generating enzyme family protein [Myxococcus sp. AM010]NVJ15160.1 SUMF1/EgtB/PvdO family nonheme iron enzyme [Myxococcus sp. AM010]